MILQAPAKVNLTLEVLGRRDDGYHEIRSVVQPISLCDELDFRLSNRVEFVSDTPGWIAEQSLVPMAVSLIQDATGCSQGVRIEVTKRIPLMSGLGGDSSDAAATLRGLNELWRLDLPREELLEIAAQLGSDVPLFLHGGTVLIEGRGERVTPLPPLAHTWVVLTVPPVARLPGKTKQLYAALGKSHYTDGRMTDDVVAALREGREISPPALFNTFENVAFAKSAELAVYQRRMEKLGADRVSLSGAGPTLYILEKDKIRAGELCVLIGQQRMNSYLAETMAAIDWQ